MSDMTDDERRINRRLIEFCATREVQTLKCRTEESYRRYLERANRLVYIASAGQVAVVEIEGPSESQAYSLRVRRMK